MRSRKDRRRKAQISFVTLVAGFVLFATSTARAAESFIEHMTKIPVLKRQTDDLENEIKHLIAEKREADEDAKVRTLTLEITEKYKVLKETGEKLEAETNIIRFHYPEQANSLDRQYVRFKLKTMHDLESEVGIDGKLDRIKQHVFNIFPIPKPDSGKVEVSKVSPFLRKPASIEENDVPEKIVLKK